MILYCMAYGIPEKQILLLQDTLMQTGLEMLMIERAPQEDVSMWGTILSPGLVRNKPLYLSPVLRLNIFLRVAVVLNYCG